MRAEAQAHVDQISEALALLRRFLDWDRALRRLDELNLKVEDSSLWDDPKAAQDVMRERRRLEEAISATKAITQDLADTVELLEMADAEGDQAMANDAVASLAGLAERTERDKVAALLSGEADANDTYVEVNAGAGGTESQDWAEMLQRMYTRWAERHGMKVELVDYHAGEQAGIKSATLMLKGENAYGYAKTESGVHRLVRISPYDSSARRHTSFASVWVYPVVDDNIDIDVQEKDLRIDTYRSSGAGGQHVNTTDSAVRITHIPPASSSPARTSAASTRIAPKRCASSRRGSTRRNCRSAMPRPARRTRRRPTSAGGIRSEATSSSPTSWSRICAPGLPRPRRRMCWTARSIHSWRPRAHVAQWRTKLLSTTCPLSECAGVDACVGAGALARIYV